MKKIFLFINLLLLPSCSINKKIKRNIIDEGVFLGYKENSFVKVCLEITDIKTNDEFYDANGLNVIEDRCAYSHKKIIFYELSEDGSKGNSYNFYNLKVSSECEKDDYYWYEDDNKSIFKPITSGPHNALGYHAYYLIDYFNNDGELEFSAKLYTEEKFNDIYKNN